MSIGNDNPFGVGDPIAQEHLKTVFEHIGGIRGESVAKQGEMAARAADERRKRAAEMRARLARAGVEIPEWPDPDRRAARRRPPSDSERQALAAKYEDRVRPMTWSGSSGATRLPPYDYEWIWEEIYESTPDPGGQPNQAALRCEAHPATGELYAIGESAQTVQSLIIGSSMVGIYFRPPHYGLLSFTADLDILSETWSVFAQAQGGYGYAEAHCDVEVWRLPLGDPASFWSSHYPPGVTTRWGPRYGRGGAAPSSPGGSAFGGLGDGVTVGTTLELKLNVDPEHWYILWSRALAYTDTEGRAPGATFGSYAGTSEVHTMVPSMTWHLVP